MRNILSVLWSLEFRGSFHLGAIGAVLVARGSAVQNARVFLEAQFYLFFLPPPPRP